MKEPLPVCVNAEDVGGIDNGGTIETKSERRRTEMQCIIYSQGTSPEERFIVMFIVGSPSIYGGVGD